MIRRRLYVEVRSSKLAIWSRRLAIFAIPVALLTVLLHRTGVVEYRAAIILLGAVLLLSLCALAFSFAALVVIWNDGLKGLGSALMGLALSAALISYPAFELFRGIAEPAISDVSTDVIDPPRFHSIAVLRPRNANSPDHPGFITSELQRKYYPSLRSFEFDSEPGELYAAILMLVQRNGWRLIDNIAPAPGRDGRIEATVMTAIMGFREDISIRLRSVGTIVRVDMRSASRFGQRDFGTNARRINGFLKQLAETRRRPAEVTR